MLIPVTMQQIISTLFVLGSAVVMSAEGKCPAECSCAPLPPLCPLGVSWVTDECGCCRVCARQFNEDCSAAEPCDHIKGLHCHLGVGGDPERGLCRAETQGLPCDFSGQVFQHGEDFQPNCQHQCTCMDGVVGCMPLCPQHVLLPARHCLWPRLTQPEGGCCEQWVCEDDNHISEEPDEMTQTSQQDSQHLPNHISALLQTKPRHPALTRGTTFRASATLPTAPHKGQDQRKDMVSFPVSEVPHKPICFPQTTEWTECSTTCGMGISSRVTNRNSDCRLARETRLCRIQHCEQQFPVPAKGKKCQRIIRLQEEVSITFAGCSTAQRYRPRICGTCTDGRCCTPSLSRTVRLRFHCPDGEDFYRNVMWIQRCSCTANCHTHRGSLHPSVSLHNDIHIFRP